MNGATISAIASTLSAIIATAALVQTSRLAGNSDANLEASTRAYIAVTGARFDGIPEAGKNQRINISFENVGIQPALDVSHLWNWSNGAFAVVLDAKQMPAIGMETTTWPRLETCPGFPESIPNRRPVYPKVPNEAVIHVFNHGPDFMPASIIEGTGSFFIYGCFIYRTLNRSRVSPYCLYYQPKRGRPIEEGKFEWCPSGGGNPS